jgi:hypothetical protein
MIRKSGSRFLRKDRASKMLERQLIETEAIAPERRVPATA